MESDCLPFLVFFALVSVNGLFIMMKWQAARKKKNIAMPAGDMAHKIAWRVHWYIKRHLNGLAILLATRCVRSAVTLNFIIQTL